MVQIRKGLLLMIMLTLPICFIGGWLVGINDGTDTGYKVAYLEMNNLLRQGVQDGVHFTISGVNARFFPRADKGITYRIAAAPRERRL